MLLRALPLLVLVVVQIEGCASSRDPDPAALRPVSELPAEYRELLHAYGRGGPEWSKLRRDVLADPQRARFLTNNLVLELVRAYDRAALFGLGQERGPFERARDELVLFAEYSVPLLVDLLSAKDGVVPVIASDVLARIGAPAVAPVLALLDHEDPRARRIAAQLLGELPHAGSDEEAVQMRLAASLEQDEEWLVRAQAARALGRRGAAHRTTAPALKGLLLGLADDDPTPARESAAGLGLLGDPAAVPALIDYLQRSSAKGDARGHEVGQTALCDLTGVEIRQSDRAWRDFWRDHGRDLLDPPAY